MVPIPLFFTGAGVYIGLGLLALSILRLGNAQRRPRGTGHNDVQESVAPSVSAQ